MSDESNAEAGPGRDRVGLIGGALELAAHVFGAVVRVFVR